MVSTSRPYAPLESASHIRLLKIFPGLFASDFTCELIHTSIYDSTQYEALSYVWGNPKERDPITCNGVLLNVGKSLASALYRLRQCDVERIVWIDAICVDQGNVPEKNHQLPLMRRIYQQAERVIVWLCPEAESCEIAMSMILAMEKVHMEHELLLKSYEEARQEEPPEDFTKSTSKLIKYITQEGEDIASRKVTRKGLKLGINEELCGLPPSFSSKWGHLNHLYNAEWFHRVWTIQEMIVAENVEVVFGDQNCSWDQFLRGAYCMANTLLPMVDVSWQQTLWLHEQRNGFQHEGSLSLLMLLIECHKRDAADQRDKIYALLGLVQNQAEIYSEGSLLKPDYALPIDEVYRKLAVHFLIVQQDLNILRAVHQPRFRSNLLNWVLNKLRAVNRMKVRSSLLSWVLNTLCVVYQMKVRSNLPTRVVNILHSVCQTRAHSDLPTWVPNWSEASPQLILSSCRSWYCAGGKFGGTNLQKVSLHPSHPNILLLKGRLYDRVASIGLAMTIVENNRGYGSDSNLDDLLDLDLISLNDADVEYLIKLFQNMGTITRCWREWGAMARIDDDDYIPYPGTDEHPETAYWRTLIGDYGGDFSTPANDGMRAFYEVWRKAMHNAHGEAVRYEKGEFMPGPDILALMQLTHGNPYFQMFYKCHMHAAQELCFAITTRGYFALVPANTKIGDTICVMPGVKTPMLLRKRVTFPEERFSLLGACFVHRIMRGEALANDCHEMELKEISII